MCLCKVAGLTSTKEAFHTKFLLQVVPYEAFFQDVSCVLSLSAALFPVGHSTGPETAFVYKPGQVCLQMCWITWRHIKTNAMFWNCFCTFSQPTGFVYFILPWVASLGNWPSSAMQGESLLLSRNGDTEINLQKCLFPPLYINVDFKTTKISEYSASLEKWLCCVTDLKGEFLSSSWIVVIHNNGRDTSDSLGH